MSFRKELEQIKLRYFLMQAKQELFPRYIRLVRRALGYSRRYVSELTLIPQNRIQYLEEGRFCRMPDDIELVSLAEFYSQPPDDFRDRARMFLAKRKDCENSDSRQSSSK